jgi:hypothetical protein
MVMVAFFKLVFDYDLASRFVFGNQIDAEIPRSLFSFGVG